MPTAWGAGGVGPGAGPLSRCGVTPPVLSAARAAVAIAPAEGQRCAGPLASPRATTSSRPRGSPGRTEDTGGGTALRCAYIIEARPSPVKGRRPARHSNSTQASA